MTGVADVEPAGQEYPAEHSPVQAEEVRPLDAPYLPASHTVHVPKVPSLYVPGGHIACG